MVNKLFKIKNFKKSLTLIEVLASIAIFSVLSVAVITLFTNSVNTQYAILQNQQLLNESGYVVEYMHKALRMAHRDDGILGTAGACTATANKNYNVVGANSDSIYFIGFDNSIGTSGDYRCMKFSISSNKIVFQESTDLTYGNADIASAVELTSSQVKVNYLNFAVSGDTIGTNQPKVTIMLDMQSSTKRINPIPRITLQTTASQRNLNVSQ